MTNSRTNHQSTHSSFITWLWILSIFAMGIPVEGTAASRFPSLLSECVRVDEETDKGIILSWSFPETLTESFQRVLISVPPGSLGTPEVLGFGVDSATAPANPPQVSLRTIGIMRSCRVAAVSIPVQGYIDSARERIRYVTGSLRISWDGADRDTAIQDDPIERILQTYLLNSKTRFVLEDKEEISRDLPVPVYRQGFSIRLTVEEESPVCVGRKECSIVAGGKPDIENISIFCEQRSVPFTVWSDQGQIKEKGQLENGDRLLFWGKKSSSPYSPESVYWLCQHPRALKPEPTVDNVASATTLVRTAVTLGEDDIFYPDGLKDENQAAYWVWKEITSEEPAVVSLPQLPDVTSDITIDVALLHKKFGVRPPIEALTFLVNGVALETATPESTYSSPFLSAEARIPGASLASGTCSLQIHVSPPQNSFEEEDPFYLDTIQLEYQREAAYNGGIDQFDPLPGSYRFWSTSSADSLVWAIGKDGSIASSQRLRANGHVVVHASESGKVIVFDPQKVPYAGQSTIVPPVSPENNSLKPKEPVDLIIVAPQRFRSHLRPLAEHYREQGIESHLASLEDIYAIFGDGRLSPIHIKDYLRWVYEHNPDHRPAYVLLVGDATWDYWGRYKNGIVNILPAYRGEENYPDENWFVCLTPNDTLPEMPIGRFPIRTAEDLDIMIQKTISHQTASPAEWKNRVFLVTDNEFEDKMDELFQRWLPMGYETSEVRVADYPLRDNYYLPEDARKALKSKTSPKATDAVVDQLNEGVVLWEYFGHGAPNVMAHERVFFAGGSKFSEARRLTNKDALPILWAFTCQTGTFDYAEDKWNISIGEDLLTRPAGGAINLLVATGRGYPIDHLILARGIHDAVFNRGLRGMAQAFAASCLLALCEKSRFEPQQQFCILGDPVFELPLTAQWPDAATFEVSFDTANGSLTYSIDSPGQDAVGRAWLRDSGHRLRWERTIIPNEWPVKDDLSLLESIGPYWREETNLSFGASAILPSGMVHSGTIIALPPPEAP
ncbi:MAG: C25 family cysteine peptidase, partial [bacterium]